MICVAHDARRYILVFGKLFIEWTKLWCFDKHDKPRGKVLNGKENGFAVWYYTICLFFKHAVIVHYFYLLRLTFNFVDINQMPIRRRFLRMILTFNFVDKNQMKNIRGKLSMILKSNSAIIVEKNHMQICRRELIINVHYS